MKKLREKVKSVLLAVFVIVMGLIILIPNVALVLSFLKAIWVFLTH